MVYELSEEAATRASKKGLTWVSACKSGEKLNFRYQIVLSFETRSKKVIFLENALAGRHTAFKAWMFLTRWKQEDAKTTLLAALSFVDVCPLSLMVIRDYNR